MSYKFKDFFLKDKFIVDELLSNNHFLIKLNCLKKTQKNLVLTFPVSDESRKSMLEKLFTREEERTQQENTIEFKPMYYSKESDGVLLTKDNVALQEMYYDFIKDLKCRLFYYPSMLNSPMPIFKGEQLEFVGVILPYRLHDYNNKITYEEHLDQLKDKEAEKASKTKAKLMKPLFINGMFNREGKRIRANYVRTVGEYPLWIEDGKPNKDYARNPQDKYYIYIQVGEYIFTNGETEYDIIQQAGYTKLNKEWYGDIEGRNKFFNELRKGKTYEEYSPLIKEQIDKEQAFIDEYGQKEDVQFAYLKETYIDRHIQNWIDARDNGGKFADFIGALCLDELDKCQEIAKVLKIKRQEKEKIWKAEIAKQRAKEAEEKAKAERLLIEKTEKIFINGGTIKGGDIIVKLADKYNINIPIRTKGWIYDCLAECTITENGGASYRYWKKKKGTKGSQKVYDILFDIRKAIQNKVT